MTETSAGDGRTGLARRVVTGRDLEGRSIIIRDDSLAATPVGHGHGLRYLTDVWATVAAAPVDPDARPSPTLGPQATEIRIVEMPAGSRREMHRTGTIDYGIVLAGEIVLVLERAETPLRQGDIVIQRGTLHAWHNRTSEPVVMAFINMSGQTDDGNRCPGLS